MVVRAVVLQANAGNFDGSYQGGYMPVTNKLTDTKIRSFKPQDKPYKKSDGGGMYLEVRPTGAKYWRLAYRLNGKQQLKSLGVYPDVSLYDARLKRDAFDPAPPVTLPSDTLGDVFKDWVKRRKLNLTVKHVQRIENRCSPILEAIGRRPIQELRAPDFLAVLRVIEMRSPDVAHRVCSDFSQMYNFAGADGKVTSNPLLLLKNALIPVIGGHRLAVTEPQEVFKLLKSIHDDEKSNVIVKLYMCLLPHLFTRPGELRLATWNCINWDKKTWEFVMPKMRNKINKDLIVPLTPTVINMLLALKEITGHTPNLFTSLPDQKVISDGAAKKVFVRIGWADRHTSHGWRATARTILAEVFDCREDLIELQLGHIVKGNNGEAYNRARFIRQRTEMMHRWSDYLDEGALSVV